MKAVFKYYIKRFLLSLAVFSGFVLSGAQNNFSQFNETEIFSLCHQAEFSTREIIASDNVSVFIVTDDFKIVSINLETLSKNWEYEIFEAENHSYFLKDTLLFIKTKEKESNLEKNIVLNTKTGIPVKEENSIFESSRLQFVSRSSYSKTDSAVKKISEEFLRIEQVNKEITAFAGHIDDRIILGLRNGSMYFIDALNKSKIWETKTGGEISSVIMLPDEIIVGSLDNFVYKLNKQNGNIIWKKRFPNRIRKILPIDSTDFAVDLFGNDVLELVNLKNGKQHAAILKVENNEILHIQHFKDNQFLIFTKNEIVSYTKDGCKN